MSGERECLGLEREGVREGEECILIRTGKGEGVRGRMQRGGREIKLKSRSRKKEWKNVDEREKKYVKGRAVEMRGSTRKEWHELRKEGGEE